MERKDCHKCTAENKPHPQKCAECAAAYRKSEEDNYYTMLMIITITALAFVITLA